MISDLELITTIQGDKNNQASEKLYQKYAKKIYQYFYYRVYDNQTSEDLSATTRCAVFDNIHTFNPQKSTNISGRIYTIAHNKLIDHFRKQKEEYGLGNKRENIGYHPHLLEKADAHIITEKLTEALEDIHPHAKNVVLMKIWENMSHQEIANQLEISQSNSKKIYSRSIQYLQQQYQHLFSLIFLFSTIQW